MKRENKKRDAIRRGAGRRAAGILLSTAMVFSMMPAAAGISGSIQELAPTAYATASEAESISEYDITETIDVSQPEGSNISVDSSDVNGATVITVKSDGVYEFTGSAENTSIVVKKGITAALILNGMTIDDSSYVNAEPEDDDDAVIGSVISCKKNSNVDIVLEGSNIIRCNSSDPYMENGLKHAKKDSSDYTLTVSGSGSLEITGSSDDAVKCKDGTFSVTSGTLSVDDCHGDGIQAEFIDISGGTVNVTTVYDKASTGFYTSGSSSVSGSNTIWENGDTKYERVNVDTGSHKALKGGTKAKSFIYKSVADEDADTYTAGTTYTDEASGGISISGGTINIDTTAAGLKANNVSTSGYTATSTGVYIIGSPDDGIYSNNTLSITGGDINIAASDDAITAAGELSITGDANVDVSACYEGIEGQTVIVGEEDSTAGPSIAVISADDGINSASKTLTYTYDSSSDEDANYLKVSVSSTSGNNTYIYSGNVDIDIDSENARTIELAGKSITYSCSGDGIDCNGSLDIEGGSMTVAGQTSGDNSPLDTNDGFTLGEAAKVLAAGCDSMGETAPVSGNGVYIEYTGNSPVTAVKAGSSSGTGNRNQSSFGFGGQRDNTGSSGPGGNPGGSPENGSGPGGQNNSATIAAGTVLNISDGTELIDSVTLPHAASYVLYASPQLTVGQTYTVTEGSDADTSGGTDSGSTDTSGSTDSGSTDTSASTDSDSTAASGSTDSGSTAVSNIVLTNVKNVKTVKGKRSFTVKWTKLSKAVRKTVSGIQVQYSRNKNFSKGTVKTVKVSKSSKSKTIKKLKSGKKYYVRVRTYKTVNGTRLYSKWSKVKTVKTK